MNLCVVQLYMVRAFVHMIPYAMEYIPSHKIKAYQRQLRTTLPLFCVKCVIDETFQVKTDQFVRAGENYLQSSKIQLLLDC